MAKSTLTFADLQALARKNGIVILDFLDSSMLASRFPDMDPADAPKLLDALSYKLGDYDEAIDRDKADAVILDVAAGAGINLNAKEG